MPFTEYDPEESYVPGETCPRCGEEISRRNPQARGSDRCLTCEFLATGYAAPLDPDYEPTPEQHDRFMRGECR